MAEFQVIYWWEWGHRQLGRVIGLVWAVGFLILLLTRSFPPGGAGLTPLVGVVVCIAGLIALQIPAAVALIPESAAAIMPFVAPGLGAVIALLVLVYLLGTRPGWTARALFLGLLGGLQGAIGWWMVSSGLEDGMLDVASYRLAIHLGLAFVILGLLAWYIYALKREERDLYQSRRYSEPPLWGMSTGLLHLTFVQILLGALVAGIDAGRSYVDWPLMGGQVFPANAFDLEPIWRNAFENAGLVQFMHRTVGYVLVLFGIAVWLRGRRSPNADTRFRFNAVFAVLLIQIALGIVTLLYVAPWHLAIAHQVTAVLLWALILRARFAARYPVAQSVRGKVA